MEAATILEDVFPAIPFGKTEIENFFSIQRADAAGAGAEAVDEPGDVVEGGDLENLEAAGLAGDPVGVGLGRGGDRQECLSNFADLPFGL